MGPTETCAMTETKLKRIAWLSAQNGRGVLPRAGRDEGQGMTGIVY